MADETTSAVSTNDEIVAAKYIARVSFKYNGRQYKAFDEIDPANGTITSQNAEKDKNGKPIPTDGDKLNAKDIIELVKSGRILPYSDNLGAETFVQIALLRRRSPMGKSMADMRDVFHTILNKAVDENADKFIDDATNGSSDGIHYGYVAEEDLPQASEDMSILARTQLNGEVQTRNASVLRPIIDLHETKVESESTTVSSGGDPMQEGDDN